ncbi:glycosyltransferase family 4 protein [Agromyces intestinalis]|uniref:Glycosyltransferase family 4 protein n=1 Tax=Agromyces intestinalis TaxID=2592652 RepID=A0A5C1YFL2_9MICO|nr:glycosyltransferase family 4 protein [Agromyces intestinalis]QEO13552.1 glycosyltransferase family 4 protein [Agromyces intestinalis]
MGIVTRVAGAPRRAIDRMLRRRASLPKPVNRLIDHVADHPDGLLGRLAARSLGSFGPDDIPPPTAAPDTPVRVYIAPTNYAAQGWSWARALEAVPGGRIGARNMAVEVPGGFDFPADTEVPVPVYARSVDWQRAELAAVSAFTHVLVEAERPLFGRLFSRDLLAEARVLREAGLSTAYLAHGTDVRLPSAHRELTPWSPFADAELYVDRLEREASRNRRLLAELGRPTFVSTPDLLIDVPGAHWCPVVVDLDRWREPEPPGVRERPIVVHVPSKSTIKGTQLIEPAMRELDRAGVIEYRSVSGVPSERMPELYRTADIVLDQFRLGSYGVAACEAMAAGRVVVGHVVDSVRAAAAAAGDGVALPIVEATPDTVGEVVASLAADTERMRRLGAAGIAFVEAVHDGRCSARALVDHWIGEA